MGSMRSLSVSSGRFRRPPASLDARAAPSPDSAGDPSKFDFAEDVARPASDIAPAPPGPRASDKPRIGEVLRMHDLITEQQLADALAESKRLGIRVGQALVQMNVLSQDQINWALAHHLGIPYLMLTNEMIDATLVQSLPEDLQRQFGFVPLVLLESELTVAIADPTDQRALNAVQQLSGAQIKVAIAQPAAIAAALDYVFGQRTASPNSAAETPRLGLHLTRAFEEGADELQFHPQADDVLVTYLREGEALRQTSEPPSAYAAILAQLRWQAQLEEPVAPWCAGSFLSFVDGEERRIPFALLPTLGEPSLLLTLRRASPAPRLSSLGLASNAVDRIALLLRRRRGLVVVAGLEASSTLRHLYALLGEVAPRVGERVLTVERISQIRFPAAYQISLERLPEPAYETALDRIRACRPAILLVDSIAELSGEALAHLTQSALGGTLVLVGVEAGDTTEAISLLAELCPSPSLLASSLLFVLAHARVHRLCPHCKRPLSVDGALTRLSRLDLATSSEAAKEAAVYSSSGCPRCNNTGHSGSVAIHALLEGSNSLVRSLVSRDASVDPGARPGAGGVAVTLEERTRELLLLGEISVEEIA